MALRASAWGGTVESSAPPGPIFDIAIIGGGVNGCGIARDAAGRGWSVYLCEKDDLASSTSSASSKLIHGGLRYLEHFEFRLVREALIEREVLWRIAPHIVWPLRFVLPHHTDLRPAWLLRIGLFLYDHLGGRRLLPPTRTLRLADDPAGEPLKPQYTLGFEYSDCWAEDARLVVLNARDAADKGAVIAPRTRCMSGAREDGLWTLDRAGRTERTTQQNSSARIGQRGRPLGQRGLAVDPPDPDPCRRQAGQRQSHRRQATVSPRPLLHPPKQGPAGVFRHAVRTRLHPDRHDRPRLSAATSMRCASLRRKSSTYVTPQAATSGRR